MQNLAVAGIAFVALASACATASAQTTFDGPDRVRGPGGATGLNGYDASTRWDYYTAGPDGRGLRPGAFGAMSAGRSSAGPASARDQ